MILSKSLGQTYMSLICMESSVKPNRIYKLLCVPAWKIFLISKVLLSKMNERQLRKTSSLRLLDVNVPLQDENEPTYK